MPTFIFLIYGSNFQRYKGIKYQLLPSDKWDVTLILMAKGKPDRKVNHFRDKY